MARSILTHLDEPLRTELATGSKYVEALDQAWRAAASAEDSFDVAVSDLAIFLASKIRSGAIEAHALSSLQLADLALACACGTGNPRALQRLEERVLAGVLPSITKAGQSLEDAEDALQQVRERLFVGTSERGPRILDYNGAGRLESWIRVAAIRTIQNGWRKTRRELPVESTEIWDKLLPPGDAELEHLKTRYRDDFRHALAEAVAGMSDRQRILLRQHVVEGVPSTQLASLYKVHRATVSRWIVVAQETLLDATRHRLVERLQITADELNSVLRLIQSQFETGLGDLLLLDSPTS